MELSDLNLSAIIPTIIGLYGVTMLSTAWKGVGTGIFTWIKRRCTTTIQLSNMSWTFYMLIRYFERHGMTKALREIRYMTGKYGEDDEVSIGFGTGTHLLKLNGKRIIVRISTNGNYRLEDKMSMTLTMLGHDDNFAVWLREQLMDEFRMGIIPQDKIPIFTFSESWWTQIFRMERRSFDSVFIPNEQKERIISVINNFNVSEQWHLERGIPYHFGIMLYGPPGSGKTSIIKAIATYFNKGIYSLSINALNKLPIAVARLPKNSILVIEDIDSSQAVQEQKEDGPIIPPSVNINISRYGEDSTVTKEATLSTILNTLDGLASPSGRIIVMTTNHIDKIAPALLRPGRIDLMEHIDFIGIEEFSMFMSRYYDLSYDEVKARIEGKRMNTTTTIAEIQNYFMLKQPSTNEIIAHFMENSD